MSAFLAMVKKELRAVTRERTIMIAIVIQLFIASFSSAILIGLLSFYDPDAISLNTRATIRVGLIGNPNPLALFLRDRHLRVTQYASPAAAQAAFDAGGVDAIIVIPPDTGSAMELQLFLPSGETAASFIQIILREPLKRYENYLRENRGVHVEYTNVGGLPSTSFEFLFSVILPVLMFFPAFVAGSMVVDSISEELEQHTLETLWSAPVSLNTIVGAKITAALVLAILQCSAWTILLRLNQIDIQNIGLVLLLAILIAALNAIGSAFTAIALRDRERSQFLYSLIILIAVSASYWFDFSPVKMLTRLATGDYYTGILDVAKYAVLVAVLLIVFFRTTKKLAPV